MTKAEQQVKTGGMVSSPVSVAKSTSVKSGRNADGTFAKGNKPKITENSGRPPECMSFRQQMKIRVQKNPKILNEALDTLMKIARDPDHPKCADAIDKLIKLNGNYDPAETKDVTPVVRERPLKDFNKAELKKLLRGAK